MFDILNQHTRYVLTIKRDKINTEDTKTNSQVLFSTFTFMFQVLQPQHTIAKPISISIECDYLTQSLIMFNTVLKGSIMLLPKTNNIFLYFNIKIFFVFKQFLVPIFLPIAITFYMRTEVITHKQPRVLENLTKNMYSSNKLPQVRRDRHIYKNL